ncbi:MAG: UDP-N-acetylenolpyruvoylglucosamine reductase [Anaerocolumna sp.]|nr:UDP-N-acetylenolpyruvoylglucosamine reductase [Anaerocolumna sp.]
MNEVFYQELQNIFRQDQIKIEEPLANHTTFKIGGPADYLVLPENVEQIINTVKLCFKEKLPYFVMGNGSNLLVSDEGFKGVIIKLDRDFATIIFDGNKVTALAGVMLSKLAAEVAIHSLTGFEFASGIPGTLGGAVTMNAGAYGGEIKQVITGATVLDSMGNLKILNKEELKLGYRKSIVSEEHVIVLEATFEFEPGNREEIQAKMNDLNERRRDKQPLEYPSAGSTFKRPEGYFAGKLIMDAGLRGYQVGYAQVSIKHCGFVINTGSATAREVRTLIADVIKIVNDKFGVVLEPEVKLLGEF